MTTTTLVNAQNYKGRCPVIPEIHFAVEAEAPIDSTEQESLDIPDVIRAKVVDKETGEAVPFANVYNGDIYSRDEVFGTATDERGNFELSIPDDFDGEPTVTISAVGYMSLTVPMGEVGEVIELEPGMVLGLMMIGEVEIDNWRDKQTPSQVKGWRRIKNFFRFGHF